MAGRTAHGDLPARLVAEHMVTCTQGWWHSTWCSACTCAGRPLLTELPLLLHAGLVAEHMVFCVHLCGQTTIRQTGPSCPAGSYRRNRFCPPAGRACRLTAR